MLSPKLLAEYEALASGNGWVDCSDRTKLELRGSDRAKFLNSFCTNDVKRLQSGDTCEAFICNVKGHVIGHVLILCREDALCLDTVPGQGPKLAAHLDRYLIREDVQIADRTAEFDAVWAAEEQETGNQFAVAIGNVKLVWLDKGQSANSERVRCSSEALEILRIEHGYPWYGVDISEENLPQEVGRNKQAISFTKGCYLGQETVARIDALGHVNKALCGVAFAGDTVPAPGLELFGGDKTVGKITSACWSPKLNRPLALAYLRRGYDAPCVELTSSCGAATVIALPV